MSAVFVGADNTDEPGRAPAGYEWERTPGRPRNWHMVRLPLSSAVWQAAQAADLKRFLATTTPNWKHQ
jgi:hypothetical protein